MADLNWFNPMDHDEVDFSPLPPGKYTAIISKSEFRENKSSNGTHLNLEFTIVEGEHKNRKVFANLNIHNPNETAMKIAKGHLSAICKSVNVLRPSDSSQLHDKPLIITVKCRKNNETGDIVNDISKYEPPTPTGVSAQTAAPAAVSAPTQVPPKPALAPWVKK
jgi:hypothetical protein